MASFHYTHYSSSSSALLPPPEDGADQEKQFQALPAEEKPRPLWLNLLDLHREALEDENTHLPGGWLNVWKIYIGHPWYQRQLSRAIGRLLGGSPRMSHWREDIKQEAMLLLARTLRRSIDLGLRLPDAEAYYDSWICKIIWRDCCQARRRLKSMMKNSYSLQAKDLIFDPWESIDRHIDISLAVGELDEPYRTALTLYSQGTRVAEMAEKLSLNKRAVYRILEAGFKQLRKKLTKDDG